MKHLLHITSIAATLLAAPMISMAQDKPADGKPEGGRPGGPGGGRGRMDPAQRLATMKEKLGLTDDQTAKIKDIYAKNADKYKALREDTTVADDAKRTKMGELRKAEMEEINALLTPEQQAKMKELRPTRGGGDRGGKPGEGKPGDAKPGDAKPSDAK